MRPSPFVPSTALLLVLVGQLFQAPLGAQTADSMDTGWPRRFSTGTVTATVYQPQIDSWTDNKLETHAAVAVTTKTDTNPTFGVIWMSARTEVDKVNRLVYLDQPTVTRATFPAAPKLEASWKSAIQSRLPSRSRAIALDRLESSLAIEQAQTAGSAKPVKNEPPRIIFSEAPALLIPIDGKPVFKPAADGVERVLNTRPFVARTSNGTYYLRVFDGWMQASGLEDKWTVASAPPASLGKALKAAGTSVDSLTGRSPDTTQPRPSLKQAPPVIYVSTTPAELIVTDGRPNYVPLDSTDLLYVKNTTGRVFKSIKDQDTYVLVSGRWFKSQTLDGPWTFVPSDQLPEDFRKIPDSSPMENVKASVAGTVQAREALIANDIPQTATVELSTSLSSLPAIDGPAKLEPIEGTPLSYVKNASVPVIRVDEYTWYAVQNGIWFLSNDVLGPWVVATSVPTVIYTIPPSSPMHYVTYVRVYGSTTTVVYVGYTPGYYGTVVSENVVVYGTGYYYDPWIGAEWYGPPVTYGFGCAIRWTPWTGWSFGFGFGWSWGPATAVVVWGGWGWGPSPWWGPAGWGWGARGGAVIGPRGGWAAWGPGGWAGTTGNVYSRWGGASVVSRTAGGFNAWTGNRWAGQVATAYNSRTGSMAAGQRAAVGNIYTGDYAAGERGIARSGQTGIVAAGRKGTAGNAYTGRSVTAAKGVVYDPRTGNAVKASGFETSSGGGAVKVGNTSVAKTSSGDIYAGHDGNVYRKTDDGWEKRDGQSWSNAEPAAAARQTPAATPRQAPAATTASHPDLDRAAQARTQGSERWGGLTGGQSFGGYAGQRMGGGGFRRR